MSGPSVRPKAVDAAAAWLRERAGGYTHEALAEGLRSAGYSDAEIEEAFARVDAGVVDGGGAVEALRGRAAAILLLGFIGTWVVMALILAMPSGSAYEFGGLAAMILGAVLAPVLVLSLIGVAMSDRLRRGTEGALVGVLAIPFVLLVIVAGLCVGTTGGLRV